jgi:hypothetical protein
MMMRYLWGLGVGHTYASRKTETPSRNDEAICEGDMDLINQRCDVETDADSDDPEDDAPVIPDYDSDVGSEILDIYS